jgi:hypothetical protein
MSPKSLQKSTLGVQRVSPAQAKRWREEMDRGAPATLIATREGCDARTVRVHVDRARRAGGASSAREELLRDALRGHQADLSALAEALVKNFRQGFAPNPAYSPVGLPASALADHLGRTPFGKSLRRWIALADRYPGLRTELVERTARDSLVVAFVSKGVSASSLTNQVLLLAQGKSLDSLEKVAFGVQEADAVNAERDQILGTSKSWDEFKSAKHCFDEAGELARELVDRLDVTRLRRYITGSCRYCPDAEGV